MKYIISSICVALVIGCIDASLVPRINGGDKVDIKDFPYQASLRFKGKHTCGACIIGARYILTAAHCIRETDIPPFQNLVVVTGTSSSKWQPFSGQSHRIDKITVHPQWVWDNETSLLNDIAVITLVKDIKFNAKQQKIDLASQDVASRTQAVFTGWGCTAVNVNKLATHLRKVDMKLLSYMDCQPFHRLRLYKEHLCASKSIEYGTSLGDAGGPLVLNNKLVGIASWVRSGCFGYGTTEVFTNVYAQRNFIQSAMNL